MTPDLFDSDPADRGPRPFPLRAPAPTSPTTPAPPPIPPHPPERAAAAPVESAPTASATPATPVESAPTAPTAPTDGAPLSVSPLPAAPPTAAPEPVPPATPPRSTPEAPAPAPATPPKPFPEAAAEPTEEPGSEPESEAESAPEGARQDEDGEEAIHTLLWTAATERPVTEVAALVAQLKESGEVSSPADVALRAAAVSRPLDEVRQLVALLNESGYDLHQAETTLRAAALGRPIEDVVALVNIIGADGSSWRATGTGTGTGTGSAAGGEADAPARAAAAPAGTAVPASPPDGKPAAGTTPPTRRARKALLSARSPLDHALAAGPGSHTTSPALRSALRWPAAAALFACGLIHLPTDLAGVRSGGTAAMVSVVVTACCLLAAVWVAVRDSVTAWAGAAAVAVGIVGLHALAGVRAVDLLASSLGSRFAWAQALAVLSSAAVIALAATALLRHTRTTGAADGT